MKNERMAKFLEVFKSELSNAIKNYPQEYNITEEQVPYIASKMRRALIDRTFNKNGRAIMSTCRKLGIRNTYVGMESYFHDEQK